MEIEKDQWPQANRNWLAMQRWLDISNENDGVTWCSLDTALFELCALEEIPGEPAGETVSLLPYGLLTLRAEFN